MDQPQSATEANTTPTTPSLPIVLPRPVAQASAGAATHTPALPAFPEDGPSNDNSHTTKVVVGTDFQPLPPRRQTVELPWAGFALLAVAAAMAYGTLDLNTRAPSQTTHPQRSALIPDWHQKTDRLTQTNALTQAAPPVSPISKMTTVAQANAEVQATPRLSAWQITEAPITANPPENKSGPSATTQAIVPHPSPPTSPPFSLVQPETKLTPSSQNIAAPVTPDSTQNAQPEQVEPPSAPVAAPHLVDEPRLQALASSSANPANKRPLARLAALPITPPATPTTPETGNLANFQGNPLDPKPVEPTTLPLEAEHQPAPALVSVPATLPSITAPKTDIETQIASKIETGSPAPSDSIRNDPEIRPVELTTVAPAASEQASEPNYQAPALPPIMSPPPSDSDPASDVATTPAASDPKTPVEIVSSSPATTSNVDVNTSAAADSELATEIPAQPPSLWMAPPVGLAAASPHPQPVPPAAERKPSESSVVSQAAPPLNEVPAQHADTIPSGPMVEQTALPTLQPPTEEGATPTKPTNSAQEVLTAEVASAKPSVGLPTLITPEPTTALAVAPPQQDQLPTTPAQVVLRMQAPEVFPAYRWVGLPLEITSGNQPLMSRWRLRLVLPADLFALSESAEATLREANQLVAAGKSANETARDNPERVLDLGIVTFEQTTNAEEKIVWQQTILLRAERPGDFPLRFEISPVAELGNTSASKQAELSQAFTLQFAVPQLQIRREWRGEVQSVAAVPGAIGEYELVVTNSGLLSANTMQLIEQLPADFQPFPSDALIFADRLYWQITELPPQQSLRFRVRGQWSSTFRNSDAKQTFQAQLHGTGGIRTRQVEEIPYRAE